MKFCIQCGSKLLPMNGAYPKFCGNCGHAVGAQILAKEDTVEKVDKEDDFEIDALQFDLQVEEDVAIKAENLLGTSDSVSQASRRTNNIRGLDQLRKRMRQNDTQDA
jgi:DNA-directed RNA polymerase subunit M/transcription elongation factor TFIIS